MSFLEYTTVVFFFNLMHIDFILDSTALKKVGYHHHPQKRQQGQVERWEDHLLVPEASRGLDLVS